MRYTKLVVCSLFIMGTSAVQAQNLVANPGFETGDFTGWTLDSSSSNFDNVFDSGVGLGYPYSGRYFAALGTGPYAVGLSQTLSTRAGQNYDISYYLRNNGATNRFAAYFGSTLLINQTDLQPDGGPYQLYSFTATATSASTVLRFDHLNADNYFNLDDIRVSARLATVPEPGTLALLASFGLTGAAFLARRRNTGV